MSVCRIACGTALALLCGCGNDGAENGSAGPSGSRVLTTDTPLPADVAAVLERHCAECHGDPTANFAPMSFVNWEDTQAPAPSNQSLAVFEVIERRVNADKWPMPPTDRPPLTDAEKQTVNEWIAQGAPSAE